MDAELRKHIENLRRDALERDPEERETFVEESCAGNEELRQAVLSLLTESELRTNPETLPAADLTTQELDPGKLQWPDGPYLGHYRVLAQLGKGAMGVVYLAHDDRLRRKIALKMLPDQAGGRFARTETRKLRLMLERADNPLGLAFHGFHRDRDFERMPTTFN